METSLTDPSPTIPRDFRPILKEEFARRLARDPKYTMRTFARDLEMAESRLCDVMNGRYGLSPEIAQKISQKLSLAPDMAQIFVDLVTARHARNALQRSLAQERLRAARSGKKIKSTKDFGIFSSWIYSPLLEVVSMHGGQNDPELYAKLLGATPAEVSEALRDLISMGHLRVNADGWLEDLEPHLIAESPVRSETIRNYHRTMLAKATRGLEHPIEKRKYMSSVLSIKKDKVAEARRTLENFMEDFIEKFEISGEAADAVYAMSLQFFPVAEKES